MRFSIKQLVLTIVLVLLTVLYLIFFEYYSAQRNQTATAILDNIRDDMSELSYILSKNIQKESDVKSLRALLDRTNANNDFISAILIMHNRRLLFTSDPSVVEAKFIHKFGRKGSHKSAYQELQLAGGFEGVVRFYEKGQQKILSLIFVLDQEEVKGYLDSNRENFLIYLLGFPAVLLLFAWGLLSLYVTRPLAILQDYLHFGIKIPNRFALKELDAIRWTMRNTFARLEQEQVELYEMSRTDALTGLANRNALHEHLESMIKTSQERDESFAFLFLDLDLFKSVNDSLGHHVGDELLKQVGEVLQESLHENEFIARVGGDEFILLLNRYAQVSEVIEIIEGIQHKLSVPFEIYQHQIIISSSVGVAFYPQDGRDFVALMQCSDIAMYEAKKNGRSQYSFYTKSLNEQVQKTIEMEKELKSALAKKEFELYYQPKVSLLTHKITGVEALVRWKKEDGSLVPPNVFIPLAEENGFIIELGAWILEEAIRQAKEWENKGLDLRVSINVAARQLLSDNFESLFVGLLNRIQVTPSKIDLEITEYLFFEQNASNFKLLHKLKSLGVTVSLDDFGTGYSSLSYLKKFPIDCLKIDKSFIDDFDAEQGAVFLETIVKMAKSLKMEVIAEGVETLAQIDYLSQIGCENVQGYFCSRPLPLNDFDHFYETHKENGCLNHSSH